MPDLIDRQDLIDGFTGPGGWTVYGKYVPAIVSRINAQPAVEATPVKIDPAAWGPCEVCVGQDDPCLKDNCFRRSARVCGYNCDKFVRYMNNAKKIHDANFCPDCGRPLTEKAWAMLRSRLGKEG